MVKGAAYLTKNSALIKKLLGKVRALESEVSFLFEVIAGNEEE